MPRKARVIVSRTQNLFKSNKTAPQEAENSYPEADTISTASTSTLAENPSNIVLTGEYYTRVNVMPLILHPESRRATVEDIEDDGDCPDWCRHGEAEGAPSHTAHSENTSGPRPADIDPNLIEIIGRFEIMDDYEDPDQLGSPDEMAGDLEDDQEDETEIQELSKLENFTATLKRAQEIAVAREREKEKGRKRPRKYTGNSQRTRERRAKINRDMQAQGFLSIGAFWAHLKDKVSKKSSTPETVPPEGLEAQGMEEGTMGGSVDADEALGAQVAGNESEGEESEEENDVADDLHECVSNIFAEMN